MINLLLWNMIVAAAMAVITKAASLTPWLRTRPAVLHLLWVVVLLKLVTPPIVPLPIPSVIQTAVESNHNSPSVLPANERHDITQHAATSPSVLAAAPHTAGRHALVAARPVLPLARLSKRAPILIGLAIIWGIGTAALLIVLMRQVLRVRRIASSSTYDEHLTGAAKHIARELGSRSAPPVLVVDATIPPALLGWITPLVILPRRTIEVLNENELHEVLTHEVAHFVRGDHLVVALATLIRSIVWWNPVAWWACREIRVAQEVCSDSIVLANSTAPASTYATAMWKVVNLYCKEKCEPLAPAAGIYSTLSARTLKRRFEMLTDQRLSPRLSRAGIVVIAGFTAVALCFPMVGRSQREREGKPSAKLSEKATQSESETVARTDPREDTNTDEVLAVNHGDSGDQISKGDSDAPAARKATDWIEKLGGTFEVDQESPDRPVVKVDLSSTLVTDDDLAGLVDLTELTVLNLTKTGIGDSGVKRLKSLQKIRELILDDTYVGNDGLESLVSLTGLQRLDLGGAPVDNAGLAHIRKMPQLRVLNLSRTSIGDRGLAHLDGLKLTELGLRHVPLRAAGFVHLQTLTELKTLDLTSTETTDECLASLSELTKLETLLLRSTNLTDEGLAHLSALTNLRKLDLFRGFFSGGAQISDVGLAHLRGLTRLEYLSLFMSRVSDAGLRHLRGMTNLNDLSLYGTDITGEGLRHLRGLKKLKRLELSATDVTDDGLAHLKDLELEILVLTDRCPEISDAGLAHIKNMTSLISLYLPRRTEKITDVGLEHLKSLTKLKRLMLGNSNVTDAGLVHLAGLTDLRWLWLSDHVTGHGLRHLTACENLEFLHVGAGFRDEEMVDFEAWPHLKLLEFEGSQVTDECLAHLRGLNELEVLRFYKRTSITSMGLRHLKELTTLTDLKISGTGIDDSGIAELKALKNLQTLHIVYDNPQISDVGVKHLTALRNLRDLRLDAVNVTDAGLAHVEELTGLTSLAIENAQVTDAGLRHLKSLRYLKSLTLRNALVTGAGLKETLQGLANLSHLQLWDSPIGDRDVRHLTQLTGLKRLWLFNTKISDAGVNEIRHEMPDLDIWHSAERDRRL